MTTPTTGLDGQDLRSARRILLWGSRALGYLVYVYLLAVEVILFLGFVLLLFGANPGAGFTDWLYRSMDRSMAPFRGIFSPIDLGSAAGSEVPSVFETSVLFAMIVYGVVALAVHAFIMWLSARLTRLDIEEENARREAAWRAQQAAREQEAEAAAQAESARAATSGLARLAQLHTDGHLTDVEYAAAKAAVLDNDG